MSENLLKKSVKGILQVTGHLSKMLYACPMDFHCNCQHVICLIFQTEVRFFFGFFCGNQWYID